MTRRFKLASLVGIVASVVVLLATTASAVPWTLQAASTKPFALTSPWNAPIPATASYTATNEFAGDTGFMTGQQNSTPVYYGYATSGVATIRVIRDGQLKRVLQTHAPANMVPAQDTDLEMTVVDLATGWVDDFERVVRTGPYTYTAQYYGFDSLNGTGFGYFPCAGCARVRAGTRSSGASWLGGLVTGQNIAAGVIPHALAIALNSTELSKTFVYPAVETDGSAGKNTGTIPMGTHLAIPRSTPRPAGMSPLGNMIFTALQTYGGYVVDRNSTFNLFADALTVPNSTLIPVRRPSSSHPSDMQKMVPLVRIVH